MAQIKAIRISMPYKLGTVNCYLVGNDSNYVLIDTGSSNQRAKLERELEDAGCRPGNLKLIILTHGDFDHAGNAVYLRHKFSTQVAMHFDDLGMVERGDMFANRKQPSLFVRKIIPVLPGFGKNERFKPDIFIDDEDEFSTYNFDAKALSIPGHSKGSIGILLASGDLFCGDLLENQNEPSLNRLMDDLGAANASIEKLKRLRIRTVYPGHGKPFLMEQFLKAN